MELTARAHSSACGPGGFTARVACAEGRISFGLACLGSVMFGAAGGETRCLEGVEYSSCSTLIWGPIYGVTKPYEADSGAWQLMLTGEGDRKNGTVECAEMGPASCGAHFATSHAMRKRGPNMGFGAWELVLTWGGHSRDP